MTDHNALWAEAWETCLGEKDLTGARTGGRVSKAYPNKEDVAWWNEQGPIWVSQYIQWRKNNPNWKIWITPQGVPAIELELTVRIGDVNVRMFIDRIFEVDGHLVIVDLKTSSRDPQSALQMGFYKTGVELTFGIPIEYGTYYMSRKAGTLAMIDLNWYSYEKMEYLVKAFDKARKAGIFIPNAENCNMCGFTKQCEFTSKKAGQAEQ